MFWQLMIEGSVHYTLQPSMSPITIFIETFSFTQFQGHFLTEKSNIFLQFQLSKFPNTSCCPWKQSIDGSQLEKWLILQLIKVINENFWKIGVTCPDRMDLFYAVIFSYIQWSLPDHELNQLAMTGSWRKGRIAIVQVHKSHSPSGWPSKRRLP